MTQGTNIRIDGVKGTVAALRAFEPDLHKAMNDEIRKSLRPVRDRAKAIYPKGSWSIRLNNKNLLGSISAAAGGGGAWDKPWKSLNTLGAGSRAAILEFVQSESTPQMKGLISTLNSRYGTPGRFLWAAWDQEGSNVLDNIEAAVKGAERDLEANLEAAGERF